MLTNMEILAKSIVDDGQLEARKSLGVKGIELLLLEKDFDDIDKTKEKLVEIARQWEVVALEAPNGITKYPMNPFSADSGVRLSSRNFLSQYADLANSVNVITKNIAYAQFQYIFDEFNDEGRSPEVHRGEQLGMIKEHFEGLQKSSKVNLQVENTTPISQAYGRGTLSHCHTAIRPSDFAQIGVPMALDVIHLSQTCYTWLQAETENDNLFKVNILGVPKYKGKFYLQMTDEDLETVARIKKNVEIMNIKDAITTELIRTIRIYSKMVTKNYGPLIGSLQFANAEVGFGVLPGEDGIETSEGMIDVRRLFSEAIIPAGISYVTPEYHEKSWLVPINQQNAITLVRSLLPRSVE